MFHCFGNWIANRVILFQKFYEWQKWNGPKMIFSPYVRSFISCVFFNSSAYELLCLIYFLPERPCERSATAIFLPDWLPVFTLKMITSVFSVRWGQSRGLRVKCRDQSTNGRTFCDGGISGAYPKRNRRRGNLNNLFLVEFAKNFPFFVHCNRLYERYYFLVYLYD